MFFVSRHIKETNEQLNLRTLHSSVSLLGPRTQGEMRCFFTGFAGFAVRLRLRGTFRGRLVRNGPQSSDAQVGFTDENFATSSSSVLHVSDPTA